MPLLRFPIYIILLVILFAIVGGPPVAPPDTFNARLVFYYEHYGVVSLLFMLIFELAFRCVRWVLQRSAINRADG